ncbi:hypothetical protein LEP1GSC123_1795 [Leptospira borgpetersenii str. 200701203]|uniref:Uncharacterized protein n=1 Tax=Leptospira borgpetersenii str. 200701203 TaxID=1193007 RepID=M3GTR0_LEPBO|nr:hypothetical protein LEP1GSC123_1795 [Leptospira borgpetersenii str. 200701203]
MFESIAQEYSEKNTNTSKIPLMIPITFSIKRKLKNFRNFGTVESNF